MRELAKDFPAGQFDPYLLVLSDTTGTNSLLTEKGYKAGPVEAGAGVIPLQLAMLFCSGLGSRWGVKNGYPNWNPGIGGNIFRFSQNKRYHL